MVTEPPILVVKHSDISLEAGCGTVRPIPEAMSPLKAWNAWNPWMTWMTWQIFGDDPRNFMMTFEYTWIILPKMTLVYSPLILS